MLLVSASVVAVICLSFHCSIIIHFECHNCTHSLLNIYSRSLLNLIFFFSFSSSRCSVNVFDDLKNIRLVKTLMFGFSQRYFDISCCLCRFPIDPLFSSICFFIPNLLTPSIQSACSNWWLSFLLAHI